MSAPSSRIKRIHRNGGCRDARSIELAATPTIQHWAFVALERLDAREQRERESRARLRSGRMQTREGRADACVGMTLLSPWRGPTFYG